MFLRSRVHLTSFTRSKVESIVGGSLFLTAFFFFLSAVVWILFQDTGESVSKGIGSSGRYCLPPTRKIYRAISTQELKKRSVEMSPGVWKGFMDGNEFIYYEKR